MGQSCCLSFCLPLSYLCVFLSNWLCCGSLCVTMIGLSLPLSSVSIPLCLSLSLSISSLCCHLCHLCLILQLSDLSLCLSLGLCLTPSPITTERTSTPEKWKRLSIPGQPLPPRQSSTPGGHREGLVGAVEGRRKEKRREGAGAGRGRRPWAGGQVTRLLGNQPRSPSCG